MTSPALGGGNVYYMSSCGATDLDFGEKKVINSVLVGFSDSLLYRYQSNMLLNLRLTLSTNIDRSSCT